jgi:hypothetical protein
MLESIYLVSFLTLGREYMTVQWWYYLHDQFGCL